jgi:hypothetical protein
VSFRLLNFGDRELAVDTIGIEFDLVADLDALEHGGVLRFEDHRHAFGHVEFLEGAVPQCDLAFRLIDLTTTSRSPNPSFSEASVRIDRWSAAAAMIPPSEPARCDKLVFTAHALEHVDVNPMKVRNQLTCGCRPRPLPKRGRGLFCRHRVELP